MYRKLTKPNFTTVIHQSTKQYSSFAPAPIFSGRQRPRSQIKVHFPHKHIAQLPAYMRHLTALSYRLKTVQFLAMLTVTRLLNTFLYSKKFYVGA